MNRVESQDKFVNAVNRAIKKYNPYAGDAIAALEMIKIDILLNTGVVIIDGKIGELKE